MKTIKHIVVSIVVMLLLAPFALADDPPRVTVSTSWVAALAEAAGADVGRVLAPVELRHPPEYDFRPGDIRYAVEADFLVWAGYESFIPSLFEAAGIPDDRIVQVRTNNTPPVLRQVVRELAGIFGTIDRFEEWEEELDAITAELLAAAEAKNTAGTRAIVHVHYQVLAEWLGYEIVAELGMGELTPSRLREIVDLEPDIVIDNWHVPTGAPLRGEIPYVTLINFPGRGGTRTLIEVLRHNAQILGLVE